MSSLRTPASYLDELAKRHKNAEKRAKKAEKDKAREEENHHLIKDDLEKKKADGKAEGCSKRRHDPSTAALKKKSAPKKKPAEPTERNAESNFSGQYDPPPTREEVQDSLSEQVNITISTVLPDLRARTAPIAPPKKIILKRKTK